MTKSILRLGENKLLIEIRKRGVDTIYFDGKIRVGDYDGVEFVERDVNEEKRKFAEEVVRKVLSLLSKCESVSSIVLSDLVYIKFRYGSEEIVAFISEDNNITFDKPIAESQALKSMLLNCKEEAMIIFNLK